VKSLPIRSPNQFSPQNIKPQKKKQKEKALINQGFLCFY